MDEQMTSAVFHKIPTICSRCGDNEIKSFGWCQKCETLNFKNKYSNWTSENSALNEIIQWSQEHSLHNCDYLEFINYDNLRGKILIRDLEFTKIYKATWSEGPLLNWDVENKKWTQNKITVVLKRFKNSETISGRFLTQIFRNIKCLTSDSLAEFYGITRHPEGDYMFVMKYYEDGNLYNYLDKNYGIVTWGEIFSILLGVSEGLGRIHKEGTFHSNLHGGNILIEDDIISTDAKVTDTGLHGFSNEPYSPDKIYGVLPFIAPEVFKGEPPSKAVDIYSFGIVMAMMATGEKPFWNKAHDVELAHHICYDNLRPEITQELMSEMPKFYYNLMISCWDPDPRARPSAEVLIGILKDWICSTNDDQSSLDYSEIDQFNNKEEFGWTSIANSSENIDQFNNAEEVRWTSIDKFKSIQKNHDEHYTDINDVGWFFQKSAQEIHAKAIYSGRLIDVSEYQNYFKKHDDD
ncbi:hypothetical protein Glove_606g98 [Diversispora epigaea]|uniref:Protein kinase domain-containing protein n=1 Tax=Diversispora epigaea TaxID=1348612 RepID=A0A397GFD6_9GLOM|nr:hypothetical protein Glove_606g98 [Diversispora epigaea]